MAEVRDAHLDEPQATAAAVPPSDVRRRASATSSRAFALVKTEELRSLTPPASCSR